MNILLISDTHASPKTLKWLKEFLAERFFKFDLALIAGDVTVPGQEDYLDKLKALFDRKKIPFWAVAGNFDSPFCRRKMSELKISLHHQVKEKEGFSFTGLDFGQLPLPEINLEDKILVTHEPPKQTIFNLGLKVKNAPRIHIAGHLHKPAFVKRLGKTLWIQVPTLQDKRLAILRLPEKKVEFLQIVRKYTNLTDNFQ